MVGSYFVCTATLALAGGPPANLLVNGSFEEPDLGGPAFISTDLPGWTQGDDGAVFIFNRPDPTPDIWPPAHDGMQYADIGNAPTPGHLEQTVAVPVNGVYSLSWWSSTAASIGGSTAIFSVSIVDENDAGVYQDSFLTAWGSAEAPWIPGSVQLFLPVGTYTVRFLPTNPMFTWDVLIDDVLLTRFTGVCGSADLAPPFGLLDLADINVFIAGFVAMNPIADLTTDGLFDLADINLFVSSFVGGCP